MQRTPPHMVTLVLLTALPVASLNMFVPSLPAMTVALNATESQMALAISGYMIFAALLQLAMGPISDQIGRRPVLLTGMVIYALASIGCFLAQDVGSFIAFRLAQAFVVGGAVLAAAVIRDVYPPSEAAGRMGAVAAAMALAPILGPTVGGVLDEVIGWRAIFGLYAAMGLGVLILCWIDLGETRPAQTQPPRLADYRALLGAPLYWAYTICQSFAIASFYVVVAGVPFVTHALWDLSPAMTGIGIGSSSVGFLIGNVCTARLAPRFGIRPLIVTGRVIPAVAMILGLAVFGMGLASPVLLFAFTIFVGFGNGLTISNANTGAMSVFPRLAGTAASLGGAMGIASGALMTAIALALMGLAATPVMLMSVILGVVLVSLAAGLIAVRLDRVPA